ncbi:hypothetical protein [Luteibacter yeojuensis]|uniref:DUF4435 domain-containing protein n=1 Tax=Luteibacter yeojuensis TaxID=345309 RepID=A0A7X5QRK7_9GAMM|nr:hypothetical protein [Luteibacter yeojuensis]NID14113.1 hypothetical protein [Luteibacter yeojuensis]
MTGQERWLIEELIARYENEPTLRDVFVEGVFDCEVFNRVYEGQAKCPVFYSIDSVNVSREVLAKYGLTLGNRQRVIALAKELEELQEGAAVRFMADRDLDHWFAGLEEVVRLKWTMFTCVEAHFLTPEALREIVRVAAAADVTDVVRFARSIECVLRDLYSLRLVDRQLTLNMSWVALRRYLSRRKDEVIFDAERYIDALLNSNQLFRRKAEVIASWAAWKGADAPDSRQVMQGHDLTELLAWAVSAFGGVKTFASTEAIERLFVVLAKGVPTLAEELV